MKNTSKDEAVRSAAFFALAGIVVALWVFGHTFVGA